MSGADVYYLAKGYRVMDVIDFTDKSSTSLALPTVAEVFDTH
jgi:hypothetical protein